MGVTISVPTLNDGIPDFEHLFELYDRLQDEDGQVTFTFWRCEFLRHAAAAFLGGLRAAVRLNGGDIFIDSKSMRSGVRLNLVKNGFLDADDTTTVRDTGNVVPFRHDPIDNGLAGAVPLMQYLFSHLLEKDWVHMSPGIQSAVAGTIWEIYANAFEHSRSDAGIFSCGQYYPTIGQVGLAIIDFGIGIPQSVRDYHRSAPGTDNYLTSIEALHWALGPGHSTKSQGYSGLGLDFVQSFMRANDGLLDIYTHDASVRINAKGMSYRPLSTFFPGTAFNLRLQCDGSKYFQFEGEK